MLLFEIALDFGLLAVDDLAQREVEPYRLMKGTCLSMTVCQPGAAGLQASFVCWWGLRALLVQECRWCLGARCAEDVKPPSILPLMLPSGT